MSHNEPHWFKNRHKQLEHTRLSHNDTETRRSTKAQWGIMKHNFDNESYGSTMSNKEFKLATKSHNKLPKKWVYGL